MQETPSYASQKNKIRKSLTPESTCTYCNCYFDFHNSNHRSFITIDHIVPQSKGGGHELENLIPACAGCNSRKSSHEERILLFRLNTPRKLSDKDHENIHRYLNSLNRKLALERVKELVLEDRGEDALRFMEQVKSVRTRVPAFEAIIRVIKKFMKSVKPILVQIKTTLQELNDLLKAETDFFQETAKRIAHLDVVPFSLVS